MSEPMMVYLYRGILLHWYRIAQDGQACTFTMTWESDEAWHWSGAYADFEEALAEACRSIDGQLANRPPVTSHQSPANGKKPNISEQGWTVVYGR